MKTLAIILTSIFFLGCTTTHQVGQTTLNYLDFFLMGAIAGLGGKTPVPIGQQVAEQMRYRNQLYYQIKSRQQKQTREPYIDPGPMFASGWDTSPSNWDNSSSNWENSPSNWKNSPYNYDNSPSKYGNDRIIRDNLGNPQGYAVPKDSGGYNIFDQDGKREGYFGR